MKLKLLKHRSGKPSADGWPCAWHNTKIGARVGATPQVAEIAANRVHRTGKGGFPMPHEVPPLGYAFDALEPHIDAKTMEIHHDKHHRPT